MNYNDIRKPLLQSALVLFAILVVIGFVAGSGADTFMGGIISIIKGILYSVLFGVALGLSLVISVALLIGLFIGATAIYSPENAKEMLSGLQQKILTLTSSWTGSRTAQAPSSYPATTQGESDQKNSHQKAYQSSQAFAPPSEEIEAQLAIMRSKIESLNQKNVNTDQILTQVTQTVEALSTETVSERIEQIESRQEELTTKLNECLENLEKLSTTTASGLEQAKKREQELTQAMKSIQELSKKVEKLNSDVESLKKPTALSEVNFSEKEEPRIFSYLEKETDKKKFTQLVTEAVQQDMTYAEIDDFLSKSLPKQVDQIIKDHPTLTKEYIRTCKNS